MPTWTSFSRCPAPLRIGLTGGIASGKSTVADMFAALGMTVIDTDLIAREVVQPGQPALHEIRSAFGDSVFNSDGTLDRGGLATADVLPVTTEREQAAGYFASADPGRNRAGG